MKLLYEEPFLNKTEEVKVELMVNDVLYLTVTKIKFTIQLINYIET